VPEPPYAARHGTFFCALQGPIHAAGGPAGCAVPVRGGRAADPACGAAVAAFGLQGGRRVVGSGRGGIRSGRTSVPKRCVLRTQVPEWLIVALFAGRR